MNKNNIIQQVLEDPHVRIATARQSFEWFFNIYLNSFITYETAPFQKKMFEIAGNEHELLSVIAAFRGSAKTTIMSLAYPIWAILGKQEKKFVVIISDTQELAKQRLANIRAQFEQNALLRQELGPFKDDTTQWGAGSIVLLKYGARITVASREQSIRGITHNQHRPDLIILDDVENLESVRTKEGRDKMHRWFHEDIMPLGSPKTKIIVIGNLLHGDSLIMRLKQIIQSKKMSGAYYEFPIQVRQQILWPGKFPNEETLERERKKVGDQKAWLREYELKIVPEDSQLIFPEWIRRYETIPAPPLHAHCLLATGIDLAISEKESADYTAMVTARVVVEENKRMSIYVLPHPVNERLKFPEQVDTVVKIVAVNKSGNLKHYLFIERVGYQKSLIDQLIIQGYSAEGVIPQGSKRERLSYVSSQIRDGVVLFPSHGSEDLITQLIGFGVEKHDDLADALVILLFKIMEKKEDLNPPPRIRIVSSQRDDEDWGDKEDRLIFERLRRRKRRP